MFSEQLRKLRRENGLTQNELSKQLNVSNGTIAMWETNKRQPDLDMLSRIALFFNVSIDYLMGRNADHNITGLQLDRSVVKIPVYGSIPAGVPLEMIADSYIEDEEEIPAKWLKDGSKYFCLLVKGESMMPKFEDGDILILRQQPDCNSGDYCAVSINCTECTFKKVIKHDNGITLQPLNPAFEPMFFSNKEIVEKPITILGVVKEIRRGL